jgi:hypothetical protein
MGVHPHALPDRIGNLGRLNLEAEFLVQRDRRRIIGIDMQFQPAQPQPVIGNIGQRGKQRGADAAVPPIVMHHDAKTGAMGDPRHGVSVNAGLAHHHIADAGDQADASLGRQPLGDAGNAIKWDAQRAPAHPRQIPDLRQRGGIRVLPGADGNLWLHRGWINPFGTIVHFFAR